MHGYILSKTNFTVVYNAPLMTYTLPLDSISATTGSVVFGDTLSRDYVGFWLYCADTLFHITQIEPSEGKTTVTVEQAVEAFDRTLIYTTAGTSYIGSFILNKLQSEYQQCSDSAYKMEYLDLYNSDSTVIVTPDVDENNLYKLSEYIRTVRSLGVTVQFGIANRLLKVQISKITPATQTVLFGVDNATIEQQTFAKTMTAKVTIVQADATTTYYLDTDGNISTTVPTSRADGEWSVVAVRDQATPYDEAKKVFDENINSHKITFRSSKRYAVYDVLRIRLDGTVYTTTVSSVTINDSDSRYKYECGDLKTTMTQKFKAASSLEALGGVSNKGGSVDGNMGIAGKLNIGEGMTIGGDLSVSGATSLARVNLNGMAKLNSELYGDTLPTTDLFEGRLFFLLS